MRGKSTRKNPLLSRKRSPKRSIRRLSGEFLEERLALDGTGIAGDVTGNDCPPDLDLSGISVQAATIGSPVTVDLSGTVTDVDIDGNPTGDTIRFVLDPDDNPEGATITTDGMFSWTPSVGQIGTFEIVVIAIDSGTTPLADAETFTVEVSNQAPQVDLNGDEPGTTSEASFTEDGGPASIADPNLVISDGDSTDLTGASITITDLANGDDEVLSVTVDGTAITPTYANGVLTLSGTDTIENYATVLRSLTYDNVSQNPGASRIIEVTVTDGDSTSEAQSILLQITSENDSPDLAEISDVEVRVGGLLSVTVTASDAEGDSLVFLLDRDDPGANIPADATITSVDATTALIEWTPAEADPVGQYTFVVLVIDDAGSPGADRETFVVTLINPVPVVDLNGSDDDGTGFAATFTEGDDGVLIVDTDLSVVDADSTDLESATVTLTNVLNGSSERITADTTPTDILSNYDSLSGVLSLTGTATVEEYQMVLRTLLYDNGSNDPDTTDRVITVAVSDGTNTSAIATAIVTVVATNESPNLTVQTPFNDSSTPVVRPIAEMIVFTAAGTDPDTPNDELDFSLDLTGAGITAATGMPTITEAAPGAATFNWTPLETGMFTMAIVLTDSDGLTDRQEFTINVTDSSASIIVAGNGVDIGGGIETTLTDSAVVREAAITDLVFAEVARNEDENVSRFDVMSEVLGV